MIPLGKMSVGIVMSFGPLGWILDEMLFLIVGHKNGWARRVGVSLDKQTVAENPREG